MIAKQSTPFNYGVYFGLLALVFMLFVTGCMAFAQSNPSASATNWTPAWGPLAQSQPVGLQGPGAQPVRPAATFIVRIKDDPDITEICRSFRRDTAGARARFATLQARYPALQGLTLEQASYSGDIVLGLPANDPQQRTPQGVLASLRAIPNVAYAEINASAYPSGEGQ